MTGLNRGASHFEPVFTLTAGPAGTTPDTLAALGRPVLYHYDPAFLELYAETVELMRNVFLASEGAGWVTGSTVNVDGGHVRH